ncbi:hypothetical protein FPQ18DRAFT_393699 [Pyronema domesticum]|nr:hypothetical protein FPQ18DRAFT_393699 [Pyronema domesticum]
MESNKTIKNEAAETENTRPEHPAQPSETPADNLSPDMPFHTPFNSPGMHRLAQNRPAPAVRLPSEMTDFEKETEAKNAHFVKRLSNAQKKLDQRDKEIEEMERWTHSLAMERRAKRDAARRQYYERKRAADTKSALESSDAPADAPTPTTAEGSRQPQKEKDLLHKSSGNKIAKPGTGGWTPINHLKAPNSIDSAEEEVQRIDVDINKTEPESADTDATGLPVQELPSALGLDDKAYRALMLHGFSVDGTGYSRSTSPPDES